MIMERTVPARIPNLAVLLPGVLCMALLFSCASDPPPPAAFSPPGPATEPAAVPPAPETPPSGAEASVAEQPASGTDVGTEFVASEQQYRQTFADIEALITQLNRVIRAGDYDGWVGHLTDGYRLHYSDPAVLGELSARPALQNRSIVLQSLRDYFTNVVMPSRSSVRLDDIVFKDQVHVRAVSIIQNSTVILYSLEYRDGAWKIALDVGA